MSWALKSSTELSRALLKDRAREVVAYMRFVRAAVGRGALLTTQEGVELALNKNLTHTLKANLYLLLYSTVEATMTQLIGEMHEAIASSKAGADELCQQLFLHVMRRFRLNAAEIDAELVFPPSDGFMVQRWLEEYEAAIKDNKNYLFSGNLDGLAIHKVLKKYGVVPSNQEKPNPKYTHRSLQTAKNNRNSLAHGSVSFRELGKPVSVQQLGEDARAVFLTLNNIIDEVDAYLVQRRYLRPRPIAPRRCSRSRSTSGRSFSVNRFK